MSADSKNDRKPDLGDTTKRRIYKRFPVSAKVKYRAIYADESRKPKWLEELAIDVSIGGIRLSAEIPPKLMDLLEFDLTIPGEVENRHVLSRVAWIGSKPADDGKFEFGVQFLNAAPGQIKELGDIAKAGTWFAAADEESFVAALADSLPGLFGADTGESIDDIVGAIADACDEMAAEAEKKAAAERAAAEKADEKAAAQESAKKAVEDYEAERLAAAEKDRRPRGRLPGG